MPPMVYEALWLGGGVFAGVLMTLAALAWLGAWRERDAVERVIAEQVVLRAANEADAPARALADARATEAVALWTRRAADTGSVDKALIDLGWRMVQDVASAYDRAPTDVRISEATRVVARLLDSDLSFALKLLERYATLGRVLEAREVWQRWQRWSGGNPNTVGALSWANWARVWGMRAYRLAGRRIPSLLLFEAAGASAKYGAKEYIATVAADLSTRVGRAAIELYAGSGVSLAERRLVQCALELLLLERLAAIGEGGEAERELLERHRAARDQPPELIGPVLEQLAALPPLESIEAIASELDALDATLEANAGALLDLASGEAASGREAAWHQACAAQRSASEARSAALDPEEAESRIAPAARPEPEALALALWLDVCSEPLLVRAALADPDAEREALAATLARDPLFVRAADRWRFAASEEETSYLFPAVRKALWLLNREDLDPTRALAPAVARLAEGLDCEPTAEAVFAALADRLAGRQQSWRQWLTPGRYGRKRLREFIPDPWLLELA